MKRPPDTKYERIRQQIVARRPPLTLADLVKLWMNANASAIARSAVDALSEPAGTQFSLPPLIFIPFPTERIKVAYQRMVYDKVKARDGSVKGHAVSLLHHELFKVWCERAISDWLASHPADTIKVYHQPDEPGDEEAVCR